MAWIVKRFIPLAGAGTLWDPDPQVTQPGETAVDGDAAPIPLTTVLGGQAWGDVILVDAAGKPQPPGDFLASIGFVKRTTSVIDGRKTFAWNKGAISLGQAPGIEQTQTNMESPAAAVLIVTGGSDVPATGRLAIRVWESGR